MLSSNRSRAKRRGIVLVLVLAMLGLLALVGVTFATFSGQARINNRNFMQSLFQPQADELIDFGLAQLITDTNDIRSVDPRPQPGPRHVRQRRDSATATCPRTPRPGSRSTSRTSRQRSAPTSIT